MPKEMKKLMDDGKKTSSGQKTEQRKRARPGCSLPLKNTTTTTKDDDDDDDKESDDYSSDTNNDDNDIINDKLSLSFVVEKWPGWPFKANPATYKRQLRRKQLLLSTTATTTKKEDEPPLLSLSSSEKQPKRSKQQQQQQQQTKSSPKKKKKTKMPRSKNESDASSSSDDDDDDDDSISADDAVQPPATAQLPGGQFFPFPPMLPNYYLSSWPGMWNPAMMLQPPAFLPPMPPPLAPPSLPPPTPLPSPPLPPPPPPPVATIIPAHQHPLARLMPFPLPKNCIYYIPVIPNDNMTPYQIAFSRVMMAKKAQIK